MNVLNTGTGPVSLINWASYNLSVGDSVNYDGANHTFVNLDTSGMRSSIAGAITTGTQNTNVMVVNPNGVTINGTAAINTSGSFATIAGHAAPDGAGGVTLSYTGESVTLELGSVIQTGENVTLRGGSIDAVGADIFAKNVDVIAETGGVSLTGSANTTQGSIKATGNINISAPNSVVNINKFGISSNADVSISGTAIEGYRIGPSGNNIALTATGPDGIDLSGISSIYGKDNVSLTSFGDINIETDLFVYGKTLAIDSTAGDITLNRTVARLPGDIDVTAAGDVMIWTNSLLKSDTSVNVDGVNIKIGSATLDAPNLTIDSISPVGRIDFIENPILIGDTVHVAAAGPISSSNAIDLRATGSSSVSFHSDDSVTLSNTTAASENLMEIGAENGNVSISKSSISGVETNVISGADILIDNASISALGTATITGTTGINISNGATISGATAANLNAETIAVADSSVTSPTQVNLISGGEAGSVALTGNSVIAGGDVLIDAQGFVSSSSDSDPVSITGSDVTIRSADQSVSLGNTHVVATGLINVSGATVSIDDESLVESSDAAHTISITTPGAMAYDNSVSATHQLADFNHVVADTVTGEAGADIRGANQYVAPAGPASITIASAGSVTLASGATLKAGDYVPVEPPPVVVPPVEPPVVEPPVVPPVEPPVVEPPVVPPVEPPVVEPPVVPPIVPPVVAPEATPETIAPVVVLTNMVVKQDNDISSPTVRANEILIPAQNLGAMNVSYSNAAVVIESAE